MKEWIISVISVVFIVTISSFIVPEGKIGNHIKGVFSFLLVFVIIKPIISIKNNDLTFQNTPSENVINIQVDTNYLEYIYHKKSENLQDDCNKILESLGIKNAIVNLEYDVDENNFFTVEKIIVKLNNAVINCDKEHINIIEEIKDEFSNKFGVSKDRVIVYE